MKPLKLFYEEPEHDRWLPWDRYVRRVARRLIRGRPKIGGQRRVFLNLCAGLRRLGIPYRVNDYRYARNNPDELACIIGKPHLLDKIRWRNPILFGAAVYSHPLDRPTLLQEFPGIQRILVPCEWMRKMCEPYWDGKVLAWPVGIDTDRWSPSDAAKQFDFLIYDKVRWEHERYEDELIQPIRDVLRERDLTCTETRYGFYQEEDFHSALAKCRAMIFLCEHETQGIAYQQALSCGVPLLAWDRGGYWQDPAFYPDRVKFAPVTSVPYWDPRCGLKFKDVSEFESKLDEFIALLSTSAFSPREYILEDLTLEKCAQRYIDVVREAISEPL